MMDFFDDYREEADDYGDVTITVTVTSQTDMAIKVTDGETECWIPKSQIKDKYFDPDGDLVLTIPEWIAEEKGLI